MLTVTLSDAVMKQLSALSLQTSFSPEKIASNILEQHIERAVGAQHSPSFPKDDVILNASTHSLPNIERDDIPTAVSDLRSSGEKDKPRKSTLGKAILPRTEDMFNAGLLKKGMILKIRKKTDSEASVWDGHNVFFRGQVMGYYQWVTRVSKKKDIYSQVVLPDGRLLHQVREAMNDLS